MARTDPVTILIAAAIAVTGYFVYQIYIKKPEPSPGAPGLDLSGWETPRAGAKLGGEILGGPGAVAGGILGMAPAGIQAQADLGATLGSFFSGGWLGSYLGPVEQAGITLTSPATGIPALGLAIFEGIGPLGALFK